MSDKNNEKPPWEDTKAKPKRGRIRKYLMWIGIAGVVAFIAYGLQPKPVEVETAAIQRGPLTVYVSEEGKTRIRNRYVISAPVSGQMQRVPFKAGDEITAGETLITSIEPSISPLLDPRARAQAEARVDAMKAALARAEETLSIARTAAQFAQTNWERVQKIQNTGSVSATDRDNAKLAAETRQMEVQSAEFALKVATYELDQAKAALLQFQTPGKEGEVVSLPIKSPISGRVLKVMQESTTVVTPGTAIMEVGDPSDIEIEAEILSRDAVTIVPGAMVSVEQWGGEPVKARVRRVEPAAFTKVSALGVEEQRVYVLSDLVEPPQQVQRLGDRYRVEVRVAVWHSDDVLLAPAGAIFREGRDWKTFIIDGGKAKAVPVEAGHSDGRMTEVLGGLKAGDEVLVHPPDTVKDGVAVKKRGEK